MTQIEIINYTWLLIIIQSVVLYYAILYSFIYVRVMLQYVVSAYKGDAFTQPASVLIRPAICWAVFYLLSSGDELIKLL
jgi:hypothetical protein